MDYPVNNLPWKSDKYEFFYSQVNSLSEFFELFLIEQMNQLLIL
jgi:hypothetical protein